MNLKEKVCAPLKSCCHRVTCCFIMVIRCISFGRLDSQPYQLSSPPYPYSPVQYLLRLSAPQNTRPTMNSLPTFCPAKFTTFQYSPGPNPSANAVLSCTPPGATAGLPAPTLTLPLSPSSLPPPGSPSSMAASSSSPTPSHPPCQPASQ